MRTAAPSSRASMRVPAVLLAVACGSAVLLGRASASTLSAARSSPAPPPTAPASKSPPAVNPSLSGTGIFTLPDATTLARGHFTVGLALDNRDRDPLGLDLFDYALTWSAGLGRRTETYGRWVASRVVSLPEAPALPPPPLDLIVMSGAVPSRPYYAIQSAVPYVNKHGRARFEAFVPGDLVLGLKRRLREGRAAWPALALGAEIKVPLTTKPSDLRSGSGTGALDATGRLTAQWTHGRRERALDLIASAAYTRTGHPPLGDRVIVMDPSGLAQAHDSPLVLPDRVDLGLAVRRRLSPRVAAVVEATTALDVGGRTDTVDAATPIDVIAGLQARLGGARLGLGLRYHGHSLRSGELRPSPLAGLVDVSLVDETVLSDWLGGANAGTAAAHLRAGSQRLLAGVPPGLPLPEGARIVPADYVVRSEHQLGFVMVCAWVF